VAQRANVRSERAITLRNRDFEGKIIIKLTHFTMSYKENLVFLFSFLFHYDQMTRKARFVQYSYTSYFVFSLPLF
jgi:hypothetical protein